jgi:carbonic anhydrase/acetyltransferase-like protein (isoleucine patch superfamily)
MIPNQTLIEPSIDTSACAYIHPTACVYGEVTLGRGVSLWPYSVIRTENRETVIGEMTNIQDFVMIHGGGVRIGAYCSITHHCTIHVCEIGDNCLIGINATIMDRAVIGANCIIAGGTFIPEGAVIPDNSIVMGSPGKVRRVQNSYVANRMNAWMYYRNATAYAQGQYRQWEDAGFKSEIPAMQATFEKEYLARYGDSVPRQ